MKTILIVDDNAVVLRTLELRLRGAGYRILTAIEGGQALEVARRERPDLVVMDINFPPDVGSGGGVAWDGFKIIDWMRRMCGASQTPIIVITSDTMEKHHAAVKAAGVLTILQKPVSKESLLAMIEQGLQQSARLSSKEEPLPTLKLAGS